MAKVYDPILCMMVDKPDKAQDAAYEIKEIGEPKYSIDKSKKFGLFVNGKLVARAVSKEAAEKVYETFYKKKAHDVAPATQRYINTIHSESKSAAENFVRQAEQDDDVPENELKYVYKAYNDKFGYKFHDSASALDEAIKAADGATGDKLYADVKAIYNLFSNILLTYTNEQSVQKLANEGTKKCLELAAKVKGVRDEAIKTRDGMFQQIFGKYSSAARQHLDRAVKELDSFKGETNDYLDIAGKWEKQLRNDLARIDEAYAVAGEDYNTARKEIREAMDSLTQIMLRKAREKRK